MVIEVEKSLSAVLRQAIESGDALMEKSCRLIGVKPLSESGAYAPDVAGETEETRQEAMNRMVNDPDVPLEQARMLRLYLAVRGHLPSLFRQGYNYQTGCNIRKDYVLARYWYAKAAERGDAAAQNNLGTLYLRGWGGAADPKEAARLYMESSTHGSAIARGNLGELYVTGNGVKQNYNSGAFLLRLALRENPYDAKFNRLIAECYEHGAGGRKDMRLALFHYQEASDFGSKAARKALRRLKAAKGRKRAKAAKRAKQG